eukprot:gene2827-biopygen14165
MVDLLIGVNVNGCEAWNLDQSAPVSPLRAMQVRRVDGGRPSDRTNRRTTWGGGRNWPPRRSWRTRGRPSRGEAYTLASLLGKLFGQASPPRVAQARQARQASLRVSTRKLASKPGKPGKPGRARQARANSASPGKLGKPRKPSKTHNAQAGHPRQAWQVRQAQQGKLALRQGFGKLFLGKARQARADTERWQGKASPRLSVYVSELVVSSLRGTQVRRSDGGKPVVPVVAGVEPGPHQDGAGERAADRGEPGAARETIVSGYDQSAYSEFCNRGMPWGTFLFVKRPSCKAAGSSGGGMGACEQSRMRIKQRILEERAAVGELPRGCPPHPSRKHPQ